MLSRILRTKRVWIKFPSHMSKPITVPRRTLIAAPSPGDGPLMERRPDRELPEVRSGGMQWWRTAPVFLAVLISCTLAIFNYQKSSSSVVSSTLFALRMSPQARAVLGDEIYFAHQMPWIWGEMNQLHGRIDIRFEVKGTKSQATMRFTSSRPTRQGMFETTEWSLELADGTKIDLLDGSDPFQGIAMDPNEIKTPGRGSYSPTTSS